MKHNNITLQKAEQLVDFIIASDQLEGLETPPEERETLIKLAIGELPAEEYIATVSGEFRKRAEAVRIARQTGYQPSSPDNQQPHPRFGK